MLLKIQFSIVPSHIIIHIISALGGECIESKQCLLPDNTYAFCQFGKCTCDINQHLTEDGRCVTSVPLEGRCHTDENCQHVDAICKGGICKCGTGRVVSDNGTVCIEGKIFMFERGREKGTPRHFITAFKNAYCIWNISYFYFIIILLFNFNVHMLMPYQNTQTN